MISAKAFTVSPACSAGIRRLISFSRELICLNSLTSSGELVAGAMGALAGLAADLVAGTAGVFSGTGNLDIGEGLAGAAGGGVAADCCCWVCVCSLTGTNGFREGEPPPHTRREIVKTTIIPPATQITIFLLRGVRPPARVDRDRVCREAGGGGAPVPAAQLGQVVCPAGT